MKPAPAWLRRLGRRARNGGWTRAGCAGPSRWIACRRVRRSCWCRRKDFFQGARQADDAIRAQQKAAALGLAGPQTATLRLDCVNGSFDLHRAAPEGLLTALDGRVLVLRSRPAGADAQAPVRELLLQHLPAQGAFDQEQVVRLRAWLAPSLQRAFTRWFAQPVRQDEAPHLNGDPFTNTQEPPQSLELGLLERRGARATQVVHVDMEGVTGTGWCIDCNATTRTAGASPTSTTATASRCCS